MIIFVPVFATDKKILTFHIIFTSIIYMHWAVNDKECILTTLEKKARKTDDDICVSCNMLDPIFDIRQNNFLKENGILVIIFVSLIKLSF